MQCKHIKTNGHRCGSPAVTNKNFCYYHYDTRLRSTYLVPALEDADAIQVALTDLARGIADNSMDLERARVLAFVLKTAANNLRFTTFQQAPVERTISTELETPFASEEEREAAENPPETPDLKPEDLPPGIRENAIKLGYFSHLGIPAEKDRPSTTPPDDVILSAAKNPVAPPINAPRIPCHPERRRVPRRSRGTLVLR